MGSYLRAFVARGLTAQLVDGKLRLHPGSLVTPEFAEQVRRHLPAIIAELKPPSDTRSPSVPSPINTTPNRPTVQPSPWEDIPGKPPHDLDALHEVLVAMFEVCARKRWEAWQYWEPPAPKPTQRPYCYVRADLVVGQWFYRPMLADVDGVDYLWARVFDSAGSRRG